MKVKKIKETKISSCCSAVEVTVLPGSDLGTGLCSKCWKKTEFIILTGGYGHES